MSALVIRNRLFSRRLPRRVLVVNLALFAALVLVLSSGLFGGTYGIGFGDVVASLTGQADEVTWMVVTQNRLPRLLTALGVGIAFGLAGEMVQTLLRNPLASPDVIGFSAGAGLGAVITVAATGTTAFVLSGALMGGAVTALFLLALTWRRDLSPGMLVLMGIGLGVTLGVVTDLLMTRLDANNVGELVKWIVGSLSARSWSDVGLIWVGLAVIAPICVWHQFALARVSLPDEVARGLGLGLLKARLVTLILAVVLVGLAVAAAGPVDAKAIRKPARRVETTCFMPFIWCALVPLSRLCACGLIGLQHSCAHFYGADLLHSIAHDVACAQAIIEHFGDGTLQAVGFLDHLEGITQAHRK